ncbi:MAG: hypothetical protein U5Q44_07690 [Dehalococcoidia bacterium]|nr:hypothetical protein [Dehalococcoidia bacterium]
MASGIDGAAGRRRRWAGGNFGAPPEAAEWGVVAAHRRASPRGVERRSMPAGSGRGSGRRRCGALCTALFCSALAELLLAVSPLDLLEDTSAKPGRPWRVFGDLGK